MRSQGRLWRNCHLYHLERSLGDLRGAGSAGREIGVLWRTLEIEIGEEDEVYRVLEGGGGC